MRDARTIAIVGASANPERPSHGVMEYLIEQGFDVIPVRPDGETILGVPIVRSLAQIDRPVDIVDLFVRGELAPELARDAIAIGASALWLQPGCTSPEGAALARAAGLDVVEDLCTRQVHRDEVLGRQPATP